MNDGLIELLGIQNDVMQLLNNKDVYTGLEEKPILGGGSSYKAYGLYLQKILQLYTYHYISLKLKLNYAQELQYIQVHGYNNSKKFQGNVDYIYSNKNYISNAENKSNSPLGIGYGVDIEYIFHKDKLYIYLGAFNLSSYIYWDNVTLMHYDLDSAVIYVGDDGYNHYKPFGEGQYNYNISFKQNLLEYYKASLNYEIDSCISIGNNIKAYGAVYANEPYINFKIRKDRYKLGYEIFSRTVIFAAYFHYVQIEISNRFESSNNKLQASLRLSF